VLWDADGPVDLNTLLSADTGWELRSAEDINDAGQIVGAGIIAGRRHAFLLSPPT
jgi:probable HAF family extracellular repeat protein